MSFTKTLANLLVAALFAMLPISATAQDPEPTLDAEAVITLLYHLSTIDECYSVDYPVELPQSWSLAGIHFFKSFTDEDEAHAYAAARGLCVHDFGFEPTEVNLLTGGLLKWNLTEGYSVWEPLGVINPMPNPYEDATLRAEGDHAIVEAKEAFAAMDALAMAEAN